MTLFSDPADWRSHRTRLVVAEKGISAEVCDVNPASPPEDLLALNPYYSLPTLVDRDLVLYDARVIMEYLDERFPHPPLLPPDPINRARSRLLLMRIESEWAEPVAALENAIRAGESRQGTALRKQLVESLSASADLFAARRFFLSDDFSMVDCALAPLLWRLDRLKISVPKEAQPVHAYCERVFARPSFVASLTGAERGMRNSG